MSSPYTQGQLVAILIAAMGVGIVITAFAAFARRPFPNGFVRASVISSALGFFVGSSAVRLIGVAMGRDTTVEYAATTVGSATLGLVLFIIGMAQGMASRGQ